MSRISKRRANSRRRRLRELRQKNPTAFAAQARELLRQWEAEVKFRAGRLFYDADRRAPVPGVWAFYRAKCREARAYGIRRELANICVDAIAAQMRGPRCPALKVKTTKIWLAGLLLQKPSPSHGDQAP